MKKCAICKKEKSLENFNKNKSKKDGLSTDCRSCTKIYAENYRAKNKDQLLIQSRDFKHKNRDFINFKNRENYHTIKKYDKNFMKKKRKSNSVWKQNNKGKVNFNTAKRYSSKIRRSCLTTKEDFNIIETMYNIAAWLTEVTGIHYHVDHVFPLNGKLVSGLHIPSNLQIITEQENSYKHNNFIV